MIAPRTSPTTDMKPNRFVFWFSIVVILMAGSAFLFKLIEFAITFSQSESIRFALIPVMTYLIVAAGFASLFFWAYLTGQFRNIEGPKFRMLEMQDEIDAAARKAGKH